MIGKTGVHVQLGTLSPDVLGWVRRAPIVKQMDGVNALAEAPAYALRVFRAYFPEGDQRPDRDPGEVASVILSRLGGYRHPNLYVEVFNETGGPNTRAYIPVLSAVVKLLHAAGVKACGPCWSTGDYEREHWDAMREAAWCGFDAIALHGYWAGNGPTPWNAYRWRSYWGAGDPPVIVTEAGWDKVRDGDNGTYIGTGGYKADNQTDESYLATIQAYDASLQADPRVVGSTLFTAAPQARWAAYSLEPLAARLSALTAQQAPARSPAPRPPPQTPKGNTMLTTMQFGGITVYDVRDLFPYYAGRSYDDRPLGNITHMIQHHSVTPEADSTGTALELLQSMHRWHTGETPGGHDWPALAYHFAIDTAGNIYYCNGIQLETYHARAANAYGVGVVWIGDFNAQAPPLAMIEASRRIFGALAAELGRSIKLLGHYEAPTNETTCPGMSHWPATKKTILAAPTVPVVVPVVDPKPAPAAFPGFVITAKESWYCPATKQEVSFRALEFYKAVDGLFWLGYPRSGWRTIDGKLSKVFQRGILEIKPEHVKAGVVDPKTPYDQLFQLRLLGDDWLKARGELA